MCHQKQRVYGGKNEFRHVLIISQNGTGEQTLTNLQTKGGHAQQIIWQFIMVHLWTIFGNWNKNAII